MKIYQIRAFLAVVRTGGIRRAAAQLYLTQSTVAKAIGQLESDLGAPLFERTSMGLRLNDAGRSLLPYAESIVANADGAQAAVEAAVSGRLKNLRISVTPTLPPTVLVAAMERFRSRFPTITVRFTSGFFSDCLPKLMTDKIDLSLVMKGEHSDSDFSSLVEEPLFEVDHGVVARADHPIFREDADLKALFQTSEWLSTSQDEAFLLKALEEFGVGRPRAVTLCDFYGIDALNGSNGALSLSPLSVAEDPRYERRIKALDPALFPLPPLRVSFFYRKTVELAATTDYMRHCLREAFREWFASKPRTYVRSLVADAPA